MQFVKFGMVGLSNTAIGYLIYAVRLKRLRVVYAFTSLLLSEALLFLWVDVLGIWCKIQ